MTPGLVLTGVLLAGSALPAAATDTPGDPSTGGDTVAAAGPERTRLDAALGEWMARTRVPGVAIARVRDGHLAWTSTWGERDAGEPLDADTIFNVASLTKPVFAMMALHRAADGGPGLDESLAADWVDPDVAGDPRHLALTPRIALSHQTGLPNWRGDAPLAFAFAPGERHEYSGEGYEYLRRAIEHRAGESMPALMRAHVLAPAGMSSTSFGWNARIEGHLAIGFGADGTPYDMAYLRKRGPNAAANMFTTIGDYGRFTARVARGAGLPAPMFAQMQRPQALHAGAAEHFGLGWRVSEVEGATVLSHDGREPGVRTQVYVAPASGDGLVILTNGDNGELLTRPVLEATWPGADALLAAIDRDIWLYLQRMPAGQVGQLANMLPRSPPFMARFLYAADARLVAGAGLPAAERQAAHDAIAPFVLGLVDGSIAPERASAVVEMALEREATEGATTGATARWRQRFDATRARAWRDALGGAEG
ncbi:serine hydrolase domain-containing protein [Marilutibacter spongiae]|uniref:Beta-lactamase family protein n=1 Tax=Marilutibacter spongiae TaxID=2025720 RepID=A0A7W3TJN3_9GAMM|nr:serine hydrolase domain-containing protein [Lysobacter spongiae]MBB1059543.1 beta-lactamase family protein [Lysobacter spongiae]